MHSCSLEMVLLLSSILGSSQVGLGGRIGVIKTPSKSSYELVAPFRPGLLPHAFVSMPRRGTIPKAVNGHAPFLLVRPRLASSKSVDGGHPIAGVVLEAAEFR